MNRRELLLAAISTMAGVMVGSPTLRVIAGEAPTASASRVVLQGHQPEMVRVLAEMIIPATDTPGAIEAGVPRFIEMMVADWYTDTERGIFLDGLAHRLRHGFPRVQRRAAYCGTLRGREERRRLRESAPAGIPGDDGETDR